VDAGGNVTHLMEGDLLTRHVTITDLGSTSWTAVVDYGDNTSDTFTLTTPSFDFSHPYDGDAQYTLTVTGTNDDRTVGTAPFDVSVENVAPTIAISGNDHVDEGTPYTLTLGPVTDPGADTVSHYIVHWGDGNTDDFPTAGDHTHAYADGPNSYDITIDLIDED